MALVDKGSIDLCGLRYSFDHPLDGNARPISKTQKRSIQNLLDSKIQALQGFEQIKFVATGIKCLKDNEWEYLHLTSEETRKIKRIVRAGPEISLKRDVLSELIATAVERLETPTSYFYSSGGGGHKSAKDARMEADWTHVMNAVKYEYNERYPGSEDPRLEKYASFIGFCKESGFVKECDVLHDFLGRVGKMASASWDEAQERGDVDKQESLASKQWLSDIIFAPQIFLSTLKHLITHSPEKLVSTQAMATPAILFAMKVYNMFYKPPGKQDVVMHLYMTDMPTEFSSHFFGSLSRLHERLGKDKLVLHAPTAIDGVSWATRCGLPDDQVVELKIDELPVRPAFLNAAENFRREGNSRTVECKIGSRAEADVLSRVLSRQGNQLELPEFGDGQSSATVKFQVNEGDENYFLMLGSKPTKQAVMDYVDRFIDEANSNPDKRFNLFAYTGPFSADPSVNCFYKELSNYLSEIHGWPPNLTVMPLSMQDPAQLVTLMLHCNTITRSGGGTIMELLVIEALRAKLGLPARKRYIHAQSLKRRPKPVDHIGVWEKGNYFYLHAKALQDGMGEDLVKVVNPSILPLSRLSAAAA